MKTKPLPPRWIRLTDEGIEEIREAMRKRGPELDWFSRTWDYRESSARCSRNQDWTTRLTRFFLWCAEKVNAFSA